MTSPNEVALNGFSGEQLLVEVRKALDNCRPCLLLLRGAVLLLGKLTIFEFLEIKANFLVEYKGDLDPGIPVVRLAPVGRSVRRSLERVHEETVSWVILTLDEQWVRADASGGMRSAFCQFSPLKDRGLLKILASDEGARVAGEIITRLYQEVLGMKEFFQRTESLLEHQGQRLGLRLNDRRANL